MGFENTMRLVLIILFIIFAMFIWMIGYNLFAGVPSSNCQQYASINITIQPSNWFTNINQGCYIEGCKVGCNNYYDKVKEWKELR